MLCSVLQSVTLLFFYQQSIISWNLSAVLTHFPAKQTHIYTRTQTSPEVTVWWVASLTFHCILHIQGEEVPHDLGADLAHTQLLWKPGGIKMDSNQNHYHVMTRLTGWPDDLDRPKSLKNDLADKQGDMMGESHYLITPTLYHSPNRGNGADWRCKQRGLKMRKRIQEEMTLLREESQREWQTIWKVICYFECL